VFQCQRYLHFTVSGSGTAVNKTTTCCIASHTDVVPSWLTYTDDYVHSPLIALLWAILSSPVHQVCEPNTQFQMKKKTMLIFSWSIPLHRRHICAAWLLTILIISCLQLESHLDAVELKQHYLQWNFCTYTVCHILDSRPILSLDIWTNP
jgi:hypothetical protein